MESHRLKGKRGAVWEAVRIIFPNAMDEHFEKRLENRKTHA